MREIVKFFTNVPVEVALRQGSHKQVEGRYGPQLMYTLADKRIMYVPLIVADRIRELDIGSGEPFEVCKAEIRDGNRRWINWQVRRVEEAQQPDPSPNAPAAAASVSSEAPDHSNGNTNGSSNRQEFQPRLAPASDGALLPVPVRGPAVWVMETAMNAAAEIARRVESRAALSNQPLQFTSEDVRAIGLTMFIQAMREGNVRWDA